MLPIAYDARLGRVASESEPRAVSVDFDSLYRAQFGFVWRSLRRLGVSLHALDDAAQEVFLVVHRRFHELSLERSPKAVLFGIAQRPYEDST